MQRFWGKRKHAITQEAKEKASPSLSFKTRIDLKLGFPRSIF